MALYSNVWVMQYWKVQVVYINFSRLLSVQLKPDVYTLFVVSHHLRLNQTKRLVSGQLEYQNYLYLWDASMRERIRQRLMYFLSKSEVYLHFLNIFNYDLGETFWVSFHKQYKYEHLKWSSQINSTEMFFLLIAKMIIWKYNSCLQKHCLIICYI